MEIYQKCDNVMFVFVDLEVKIVTKPFTLM